MECSSFVVKRVQMKKKWLIWCLMLCMVPVCVACGEQDAKEQVQSSIPDSSVEIPEGTEADSEVQKQAGESSHSNCIIQVQTDTQRGSGVLWDKQEEHWTIVTAAHVVEGLEQAEVYLVPEDKMCLVQVYCVEGLDLAFLRMDATQIETQIAEKYEACIPVGTEVKSNDMISAVGYNASAEKLEYDGAVQEPWIYTEDFGNYMLWGECKAEPGMSGGGVFTGEGALAGIICGENEEGQMAVLPTIVIEGEYSLFINN